MMLSFEKLGLRSKLMLLLTGTALTALVLACTALVYFDQVARMKDARASLEREADKFARQSRVKLDFDLTDEMDSVFEIFFENPQLAAAAVYRADGSLFRYRSAGNVPVPERTPNREWKPSPDHLTAVVPVANADGTRIGMALLIRNLTDVRQRAHEFVGIAGTVLGVSFIAALLVSLRLQRHITGPLLELSSAATEVARRSDYSARVRRRYDDEIGELVDDFNEMLAQLQMRDARLKEAQDTLEQKVTARTAELLEANTKLRAEIEGRERAETALDRSQRKLLMHVNQTPLGVMDWNLNGESLSWNPAAEKIFGWNEQEVVGRNWRDFLVAPDQRGVAERAWEGVTSGQDGRRSILNNRTKDGRAIICEWFSTPLVDAVGRVVGVASMVQDITQRVRSETALRESEERFVKAFQASPAAIAILALDDGRFLDVNDRFVQLLDRDREETLQSTDRELGIWTEESDRGRLFTLIARHQSVRDFECRLRSGQVGERVTLLSAEGLTLGDQRCMLLQAHDVTERVSLEEQLRQSQKMEAIGQLAAGVAHDFNNILTIIKGHASLLSALPARDAEEAESVLEIDEAAKRAANLTRQLLAFSRKQVMHAGVLDLNELVRDAVKMLQRLVGETVSVRSVPYSAPALIEADAGMIEQVIVNFAVNARDAMPGGGQLTLTIGRVLVSEEEASHVPEAAAGAAVVLSVSDNGVGMDAATRAHIFEPFFTAKGVGKGTGLGLATVYGIVRQHRGWIAVDSELERGATFRVYLPEAGGTPERADSNRDDSSVPEGRETILLAEDEPALRKMVTCTLQRHGYRVIEAKDGPSAIDQWREHKDEIDLMITDMVMPGGMNGRELARRLTAERPDLKVIYTSGYSQDLFIEGEEEFERLCFMAKPYAMGTLARVLRQQLDEDQSD